MSSGDWTTDNATNVVNSSVKFKDIVADVKAILSLYFVGQSTGIAENTATLIVALMAHTHRLAPNSNWTDWTSKTSSEVTTSTQAFRDVVDNVRQLVGKQYPDPEHRGFDLLANLIVNQIVQTHQLTPQVTLSSK